MTISKKNSLSQGDSLTTGSSRKEPMHQSLPVSVVFLKGEQPITTSRLVAKAFGKNHQHVLRDIRRLSCSEKFKISNFRLVKYKDAKGEMRPEYQITKDGFSILTLGYTGERVMQFKEGYIEQLHGAATSK